MWQERTHGHNSLKDSATEPSLHVLGVGVPGQADLGVAARFHDRLHVRRVGRALAVDLDPDFDAGVVGRLAAGDERLADLVERLGDLDFLRQAVGPHLDALAAEVGGELHELLARLDVLLDHGGVGVLELADAAASPNVHAGVGETIFDVLALVLAQRTARRRACGWCAARPARRRRLARLEKRRKVPVGGEVVGDEAEAEFRLFVVVFLAGAWRRGRRRGRRRRGRRRARK